MKSIRINIVLQQLIKACFHYSKVSCFVTLILVTAIYNSVLSQTHNIPASGSDTWTICSGTLYDNGGAGDYTNSVSGYTVITPSVAGNFIRVSGTVITEGGYDYLTIYDGVGTGGPVLWGGSPHGSGTSCITTTVPTITSTSGSLTVRFYSDGSNVCAGVVLTVSCYANEMIVPATGSNSYTSCSGHLYDNGGSAGDYGNSQDGYTIIYPTNPSQAVQMTGNYNTESGYEHIYIYDGAGTGGAVLYNGGSGSGSIGTITSSGANVPLTVRFTSDGSVIYSGFDFTVSCYDVCTGSGPASTLNFDGTNDIVTLPTSPTVTAPYTVEFWAKPESTGTCAAMGSRSGGTNNTTFDVKFQGGTNIHADIGDGNSWLTTSADAPLSYTLGTWYHIAYVVTTTGYTIYINGVLSGSGGFGGTPLLCNSSNRLSIGANSIAGGEYFDGNIDEIRIWNYALTQAQIQANLNCEQAAQSGLVALYHFNQGTVCASNAGITSLTDASGNSYTGTLSNFALTGSTSNWTAPGAVTSGTTCCTTPTAVTVSGGGNFCSSITLTATGGLGGTIYWQGTTSNGTSTATPSTSQSVSASGTYYFRALNACGVWGTQGSATVTKDVTAPSYVGYSNVAGFSYNDGTSYWVNGGDILTIDIQHTDNVDVKTQYFSFCHSCTPNVCGGAPNEIKSYNDDGSFTDWMANDSYLNITGTTVVAGGWASTSITNRWSTTVSASCPDWDWYPYTYLYDWCSNGVGYTALGKYVKVDNTAPSTPGTPVCTSGSGTANLSWSTTGSTDSRSGMNTSGYQWQWSYDGSSWNSWFTGGTSGSGTWACGSTVYVRVRSVDNVGNYSAWSSYGTAVTYPTASITPAFAQFCYGGSQILTAVTGCSTPVYDWLRNGVSTGVTTPTYTATTPGLYSVKVTCGTCSSTSSPVTVVVQSNSFTLNVTQPPTTGLSVGDYIWSGNTSITWAVPSNWLVYQGAGVYTVAVTIPDSSKNVFIRAYAGCASNLCNIVNSYTGHCKSITIESSLTMGTASVLNVARNWTNTLGTLNPGTGTVAFNGQKLITGTIYTGGDGAGKQFNNVEIKSASNTTPGSNDGNKVNLEGHIRINNNFVMTSGYQFNVNSGSNMSIGGNFTHNVCEFNRGLGTVTLTGSGKVIDGAAATYFRILNISGSYTLTEPSIYLWSNPLGDYGDLNIIAGGSLNATDKTIYIDGNWTNNGTFTAGTSTVSFERSYDQTVFSGGSRFYNFRMNRNATPPYVTLTDPAWITGYGNFLHGVVQYSGTGSLTFTDNATSNGGADTSFVDEPVIKIGNENFLFPVGKVTVDPTWRFVWAPLGIANATGLATDQFNCEYYFIASPHNLDPLYMCNPSILNHTSGIEYWNLDRNVGSSIPFVTLYWKNGTRSGITNLSDLVVAHWENCPSSGTDKWSSKEGAVTGGSTLASGSITNTIVFPNFSPVTFGTKLNTNPLPVELLNFAARCEKEEVYISWATATETNNDYFTIQRSADANNWEFVKSIPGGGNSNTILYYSAIDNNPFNGTSYYRLKQTDYNGHTETFSPMAVICGGDEIVPIISYYPNPFTSDIVVDIQNLTAEKATLVIYDMLGKKVFDKNISSDELMTNKFIINLNKLAAGVYTISFTSEEFSNTSRIVKNF